MSVHQLGAMTPNTRNLARHAARIIANGGALLPGVLAVLQPEQRQRVDLLLSSGFSLALELSMDQHGQSLLAVTAISPAPECKRVLLYTLHRPTAPTAPTAPAEPAATPLQ
jgi:hypothetical protein